MEKNILYRGKRKDNGQWTYGYGFVMPDVIMAEVFQFNSKKQRLMDMEEAHKVSFIEEFIGVCDIHGEKIYEGDYCKALSNATPCGAGKVFLVMYLDEFMRYMGMLEDGEMFELTEGRLKDVEVVGNFHDNNFKKLVQKVAEDV